jgi:hypothetical protein
MSNNPTGYPRRDFLGQCAAIPLATAYLSFDSAGARGDQADDLQAMLKYVPPIARYEREQVPDADNAWTILLKAKEVIQIPDELSEPDGNTTPWDEAMTLRSFPRSKGGGLLHDTLLKHADALRLIDQAAAKTRLQYPEPSGWKTFDRDFNNTQHLRNCFMLKTLHAKLAFHEQRFVGAARDLCDLLWLSQKLICADGFAFQLLVTYVLRADVLRNLRRLSVDADVPSDVVKRVLKSLEEIARQDDGAAQALRVELCCFALPILIQIPDTTDVPKLVRGLMTEYVCHTAPKKQTQAAKNCGQYEKAVTALFAEHPLAFDRLATVELCGKITVDAIEQLRLPFLARKRALFDAVVKELNAWPKSLWIETVFPFYFVVIGGQTEKLEVPNHAAITIAQKKLRSVKNPLGKMLALTDADTYVSSTSCTAAARLSATRLFIALNLFERANRKLPATLDLLIESKLLTDVPQDPFDGKPFKYSAERGVIWCVGEKGENEGVVPEKDDPEMPFDEDQELTWRIKVA